MDATADAAPSAWVFESTERRAARLVRHHGDVAREVRLGAARCFELRAPPQHLSDRVERALGHDLELRMDCDVARYPLGRGWVVLLVEPPADGLEPALDDAGLAYREVRHLGAGEPIQVCTTRAGVGDPGLLQESLSAAGLVVSAMYEVGGCERP